jgi:F-type H+-transporting ATPase subunit b
VSPIKRFFLIYGVVYFAGVFGGLALFGGPNISADFLDVDDNRERYQRYLEIIKSDEYKLYLEMAGEAPPEEASEALQAAIARAHAEAEAERRDTLERQLADHIGFVHEFEEGPAFQAEERRRFWGGLYFDFFNAAAVAALVLRFTAKPLLNVLDQHIAEIRNRIDHARRAREEAEARKAQAAERLEHLEQDEEEISARAGEVAEREAAEVKELERQGIDQIDQETEERVRMESHNARLAFRALVVERAVELVAERYREHAGPERQGALVEDFVRGLENRS